jgi:hypothetical protein
MPKISSATTISQNVRTAGGIGTDFIAMNIINEMMFIAPFQTPFLNYMFMNKAIQWNECHHLLGLCEIIERELTPFTDTVSAVNTTGVGSATIVFTPSEPNLYRQGTSIKFIETGETGIITTATHATQRTATKDQIEGSAVNWVADPSAGSKIVLLGSAHGENDDPPTNVYTNPYIRKTRIQLFQETIKMTDWLWACTNAGGTRGGNYWTQEMKDKSALMKINIENAMVMNNAHSIRSNNSTALGTAGATMNAKTEGAFYQVENNGGVVFPYGASADRADIKAFFRSMTLGSKKKTFFVGPSLMNDIEDAIEDKVSFTQAITRYGPIEGDDVINVLRWRTNNLIVDVIRNPMWTEATGYDGHGLLLDDGYVQGFYGAPDKKGSRKFRLEQGIQTNGAPREEAQFLAHVGIGIECAPCHGVMKRS